MPVNIKTSCGLPWRLRWDLRSNPSTLPSTSNSPCHSPSGVSMGIGSVSETAVIVSTESFRADGRIRSQASSWGRLLLRPSLPPRPWPVPIRRSDVVEGGDEVHLGRARVGETHLDPRIDQRPDQRLGTVHDMRSPATQAATGRLARASLTSHTPCCSTGLPALSRRCCRG